ncbi:PDZ domain-containing protein [Terasakiella pusilla]|jgi:serine protease Do|uniref:PDZ domain-containing protein n=1 Tax=Terasakiella pusilla TaxID=64973 RepID=UPI003AA9D58C
MVLQGPLHKMKMGAFTVMLFLGLACLPSMAQATDVRPFFGLQIQGMSPQIVRALGLETTQGVLIRDIAFPGPASQSDVRRGDVIQTLNGEETKSVEDVLKMVEGLKPGSAVTLGIYRQGTTLQVPFDIGEKPPVWEDMRNNFATIAPLGITFAALTPKVQTRFDLPWSSRGVVVSLVDAEKAAGLDIQVGDVVVQVNQFPVWKPGHIVGYMKRAQKEKKDMVLLLIERANGFRFAFLPVPQVQ